VAGHFGVRPVGCQLKVMMGMVLTACTIAGDE
jgi:hypothetical protein